MLQVQTDISWVGLIQPGFSYRKMNQPANSQRALVVNGAKQFITLIVILKSVQDINFTLEENIQKVLIKIMQNAVKPG